MKKLPYRVRGNPKGLKAWSDSSSVVLTVAGAALTAWGVLSPEQKVELLVSIGLSPYDLALVSMGVTVVAALIAKHTSLQRVEPPAEPEQNHEGPDHEL